MGYINHSFLIRLAVFGGALATIPVPAALAQASLVELDSLAVVENSTITPDPSLSQTLSQSDLAVAEASQSTGAPPINVSSPAIMASVPPLAFSDGVAIALSERSSAQHSPLPPQLNQASQLPIIGSTIADSATDHPATDRSVTSAIHSRVEGEQVSQLPNLPDPEDPMSPVEEEEAETPEIPPSQVPTPTPSSAIDSSEIVPDTGQAPSTASDDLLESEDLPPEAFLADPNPLSVPTLEMEVLLKDGEEQTLALEDVIELAYFNNQDLQVALLELEQAEAALREARAAFSPTVVTSADVTAQETDSTSTAFGTIGEDGINTSVNAALQLSYDVFTSGQRSATVRAAAEQVRLSELEIDRRREELRLNTTSLYYDLQESGEQIRINQSFLEEAQQNQRDNELRRQAGVGTRFDVLRADVQLANAQQAVTQSQSQQRIARRNLARLLNFPSTLNINSTPVPEPGQWDSLYERWELTLEDSILLAFQGRVELEQQLAQREISTQQARAIRATNRPQVSLFANYSLTDLLDNSSDTYNFGAQFNMVLVDGGAVRASARQQEIIAKIAEERFSELLDQVRFEVEQAYFTLRSNEENVRTARTAITQAATALELANLRLDAGVGTQLDVLTAQSELTQAEGNWVSAALGYNRALASLRRAVSNLRSTL